MWQHETQILLLWTISYSNLCGWNVSIMTSDYIEKLMKTEQKNKVNGILKIHDEKCQNHIEFNE